MYFWCLHVSLVSGNETNVYDLQPIAYSRFPFAVNQSSVYVWFLFIFQPLHQPLTLSVGLPTSGVWSFISCTCIINSLCRALFIALLAFCVFVLNTNTSISRSALLASLRNIIKIWLFLIPRTLSLSPSLSPRTTNATPSSAYYPSSLDIVFLLLYGWQWRQPQP